MAIDTTPVDTTRLVERHLLRTLSENTLDLIYAKDTQGHYLFVNDALVKMLGLESSDDLIGLTDLECHPEELARAYREDDLRVISTGVPLVDREELVSDSKTDEFRWHSTTKVPLFDDDQKVIGLVGITRDITLSKQTEREAQRINAELEQRVRERTAQLETMTQTLEQERNLMRTLIDSMPDIIYAKDTQSRFLLINEGGASFLGADQASVLGKTDFDFFSPEMATKYYEDEQCIMASGDPLLEQEEPTIDHGTGHRRWILTSKIPIKSEAGTVTGVVGIGRDITKRRLAEERIRYLATHDHLTGLPNRTMFSDLLERAVESAQRYHRKLALLFIDLDQFKRVNDSLGHDAGDQLLGEIARRFTANLRTSDVIARFGGDEFIILAQEVAQRESITQIAEKIIASATTPVTIEGQDCTVTASVGISLYPSDAQDEKTLMKHADSAMYRAKERGKNTYCFFADENE